MSDDRPLDVQKDWAELRDLFRQEAKGKAGLFLPIGVWAEYGVVAAIRIFEALPFGSGQPRPAKPHDWWQVIRLLQSKARPNKCFRLETIVLLDGRENPMYWTVKDVELDARQIKKLEDAI